MPAITAKGPIPNAGVLAKYRRNLLKLVRAMTEDADRELWAAWNSAERSTEVEMAQDLGIFSAFKKAIQGAFEKWNERFDRFSESFARGWAKNVNASTTTQVKNAMKEAGLTVEFSNSRRVEAMIDGIVAENVRLIKTIPEQMMGRVEEVVLESVKRGRDMNMIAQELKKSAYGITERRAVMIARDQTNKATEAIGRARAAEVGVTHGFWMHRSGGKVPRTTHRGVMNGQPFKLDEGLYDPDPKVLAMVKPGELINCHCTFRMDLSSVIGQNQQIAQDSKRGRCIVRYPSATVSWSRT